MGEDLTNIRCSNIRCSKIYIDGEEKEIESIKDFDTTMVYEVPDNEYTNLNLNNQEVSCTLKLSDKKLNKYYYLMNNSKNRRIRKKNNKKYHERFIEKYGILLGLE